MGIIYSVLIISIIQLEPMITLPSLPYAYDALEPYIDRRTMTIHHTKHHQAYIDKINSLLETHPELQKNPLEKSLRSLSTLSLSENEKKVLINHGGGHLNHSFFWTILSPKKEKDQKLIDRITQKFGTLENFKSAFSKGAMDHFGSGWMWLVENKQNELELYSTSNQDSPYLLGHSPLIGLDLWEHAYYLGYQNKRSDYINAWWNILKFI